MGVRLRRYNNGIVSDGNNTIGTQYHNELENRDLDNQHPINAITGLQEVLDNISKNVTSLDKSPTNALMLLQNGLYSPEVKIKNTNTITLEQQNATPEAIYENGIRFSHYKNNFMFSESEANLWYWDSQKDAMVLPSECSKFCGIVTNDAHDSYNHQVTITSLQKEYSTLNGVVLAFAYDEENNPHTLSLIVRPAHVSSVELYYNYALIGQEYIGILNNTESYQNDWANIPNGFTVKVIKNKNIIEIATTAWNSKTFAFSKTIDLNNYSWGHLFSEAVHCGYCSYNGSQTYFSNIKFTSDNSPNINKILAKTNISKENYNSIVEKNDGVYSPGHFIKLTVREW